MKSDTTTVSLNNHLIKYADDVNLIVPEISDVHIGTEFIHIKQWAIKIKWLLIYKKTVEMVFQRSNLQNIVYPASFDGIDRVQVASS